MKKIAFILAVITAFCFFTKAAAQNDQEILKKQTNGTYYKLLNNKEVPSFDLTLHELGMLSVNCSKCPHILMFYLEKESKQVKRNCFFNREYKLILVNYDKDSFVTMAPDENGEPIINFMTKDKNKLKSMTREKVYEFAENTVMKFELE